MCAHDAEFFSLPPDARSREFQNRTAEEQWRVVEIGTQTVEPPALDLVYAFASQGQHAIPLIRSKLASSTSEAEARDLIHVLSVMQRKGIYNVRGDQPILLAAQQKVNSMHGPWKQFATQYLSEIDR